MSPSIILDTLGAKLDNLKSRDDELKVISPRLEAIVSRINSLADMIQRINISEIVMTNENLPVKFRNPDLLDHTRELERDVKAVLSTASTAARRDSTVWGTSDIRTTLSSVYGDILNDSRKADIKRWVLQSKGGEELCPQTDVNPNVEHDSCTSADKHFNDSQDHRFGVDNEIEVDLVNELLT